MKHAYDKIEFSYIFTGKPEVRIQIGRHRLIWRATVTVRIVKIGCENMD
jgi:hypothetical protein